MDLTIFAADVAPDVSSWTRVLDQGLAMAVAIAVFLAGCYAVKRVFGPKGYAEILTQGHLTFMDRITVGQEQLNDRIDVHCTEEEASMRKLRRGAVKCIDAALASSSELNISEDSRVKLVEAKAEFQNGDKDK